MRDRKRSRSESRGLEEVALGFAFSIMWVRHESWARTTSPDARRVRRRGGVAGGTNREIWWPSQGSFCSGGGATKKESRRGEGAPFLSADPLHHRNSTLHVHP